MKTIEYRTQDKSEWGEGPWTDEPDKMQWQDPATGLPCLIVRNGGVTGALCGYVGVPESHPLFGTEYGALESLDLNVHGGINFAGPCREHAFAEAHDICHTPEPGEPDRVWWLGFDCAHGGDVAPKMRAFEDRTFPGLPNYREMRAALGSYETYKTIAYVQNECTELAAQLAAVV